MPGFITRQSILFRSAQQSTSFEASSSSSTSSSTTFSFLFQFEEPLMNLMPQKDGSQSILLESTMFWNIPCIKSEESEERRRGHLQTPAGPWGSPSPPLINMGV